MRELAPLIGLLLVALGAEGAYRTMRDRNQAAVTCADLAAQRPTSHQLRVSGCDLDFDGAGYRGSPEALSEVFVPARAAGTTGPAHLVLASRDPAALSVAKTILAGTDAAADVAAARTSLARMLQPSATVQGLVRSGPLERWRARRVLSGLPGRSSDDAVILDVGGKPNLLPPALALAAGALLVALGFRRASRVPREASLETPAHPESAMATPVPAARGVAIPRLLLVDVRADAGPDAVETAPPLGARRDVVATICGVVPDLDAEPGGRVLRHRSGALSLDLGVEDPVATVVIDARGEGGVALTREILLMTGWRAFAPKTGLFVTADDLAAIGELAGAGSSS